MDAEAAAAEEARRTAAAVEAAYQKQLAEQLEAEKERRVAHLLQMAARRLSQQGLAVGWRTWQGQYLEARSRQISTDLDRSRPTSDLARSSSSDLARSRGRRRGSGARLRRSARGFVGRR